MNYSPLLIAGPVDFSVSVTTILAFFSTLVAATFAWFYRRSLHQERAIEAQLKHIHDNLDFALQSGRMGTWDINLLDGSVICSPEMLDLWGVTAKEYNNKRTILQSKVHPDDVEPMKVAIDNAVASDGIYEMQYRILPTPGQVRWVMSRGRCAFAAGSHKPERFSGVVFDITASKQREEALQEAVRARDHFLNIASHELRTPITNILMQLQLRLRDLKRNNLEAFTADKIAASLNEQLSNVERLNRLIESVLTVSQIADGRLTLSPEYFDLCKLASDVVERFPGVEFEGCAPIYGTWDWFRLEQVLLNLILNAIRYGNNKPVQVSVHPIDKRVQIVVRDHGMGISPADQSRVFQRFERAISENEVCGLGLGLYITNTIVQLHGGEIHIKSEVGQGSEFAVILPLERGQV